MQITNVKSTPTAPGVSHIECDLTGASEATIAALAHIGNDLAADLQDSKIDAGELVDLLADVVGLAQPQLAAKAQAVAPAIKPIVAALASSGKVPTMTVVATALSIAGVLSAPLQ